MSVEGNSPKTLPSPFPFDHVGECRSCGRKKVYVTAEPNARCVDIRNCDAQRAVNAANYAAARARSAPKPVIDEKKRVIASVVRRRITCYFRRERVTKYKPDGTKYTDGDFIWELVPDKESATRLEPREAEIVRSVWAEAKFEDA